MENNEPDVGSSDQIGAKMAVRRWHRERIKVEKEGVILPGTFVRWELDLLRLATRQTTAVLRLDGNEVARTNGDNTDVEPETGCVGIFHRHGGLQITLHVDQLRLTEAPR